MKQLTQAQEVYLELIKAGGIWRAFNGPRIAADLRASLPLWRTAIFTRQPRVPTGSSDTELRHRVDLIELRDQPKGEIHLDRLFIVPEPGRQDDLEKLAHEWHATENSWLSRHKASQAMGASRDQFQDYAPDELRFVRRLWWE